MLDRLFFTFLACIFWNPEAFAGLACLRLALEKQLGDVNLERFVLQGLKNNQLKIVSPPFDKSKMGAKVLVDQGGKKLFIIKNTEGDFLLHKKQLNEVEIDFGKGSKFISYLHPIEAGTSVTREKAFQELASFLDFDVVVPITVIQKDQKLHSVQPYMDHLMDLTNTTSARSQEILGKIDQESFGQVALMDFISGNTDGNAGNYLVGLDFKLTAIDGSLTFPSGKMVDTWSCCQWLNLAQAKKPIPVAYKKKILNLDLSMISQKMREEGIDEEAIKLMEERVKTLKKIFQPNEDITYQEAYKAIRDVMTRGQSPY